MNQVIFILNTFNKKAAVIAAFFIGSRLNTTSQFLVGRHLISRNNHCTATLNDRINTAV